MKCIINLENSLLRCVVIAMNMGGFKNGSHIHAIYFYQWLISHSGEEWNLYMEVILF